MRQVPHRGSSGRTTRLERGIGCRPDPIQQPLQYPSCPECGEEMNFYAQLDSIYDEFVLGDVGMVYVFVCFYCQEAGAGNDPVPAGGNHCFRRRNDRSRVDPRQPADRDRQQGH